MANSTACSKLFIKRIFFMLDHVIGFAVRKWPVVLIATTLFCLYGWSCYVALPIEAFPDVTDPMVEVVGLYPGQASEEVERRITVELERVLAGTPRLIDLRSVSVFGLSLVTLTFQEKTPDFQLRTLVAERLRDAQLPAGAEAIMGPQATPVGQIYRYTLRGPRSLRELRSIQDFVIERRLRSVPGVADLVTFGGFERNYHIRVDPRRLGAYGIGINDVHRAVATANENAGGGYVGIGSQEFVVRGLGVIQNPSEIGEAVIRSENGVPIRVRDVSEIVEGSTPRRGAVGRGRNDEVVEGIVLLRRGENPSLVLEELHSRIKQLNEEILPKDVRISTFYDRTDLVAATLSTVGRNLFEGAALVLLVVYVFLKSFRALLIVAVVVPVAMLSAFVGLSFMGLPANLISLGAIDFGILVDGAIIVVEATMHAFETRKSATDRQKLVEESTDHVARAVLFAMLIIIIALAPIFTLERVEGRIFAPMAYTYAFALGGALVAALAIVPSLESLLMRGRFEPREPRWIGWARGMYLGILGMLFRIRVLVFLASLAAIVGMGAYASTIGTEFLPELNEGGFYITSVFPSTISLDETCHQVGRIRTLILETPEVADILSHVGRPEDATQAEGSNNAEFFVILKPETQWREGHGRRELEDEMRRKLAQIPGVQYNFSQPITDRVFETISGIIGQVVIKIHGSDLMEMTRKAEEYQSRLSKVTGVTDLALYQAGDIPSLRIDLDRDALARRGLSVDDVQQTIRIALGGETATEVWNGERRYSVTVRLPEEIRANPDTLGRLSVGEADDRVTLAEIAKIEMTRGRSSIWREDFTRFVAVKFNVRGRDLGSTVDAARDATKEIQLPEGSYVTWGGEFQNQKRAMNRLSVSLPLALAVILGLLWWNFKSWRPAVTIFVFLPVTVIGAVAGLHLLGENFSVSSAVGCIALLGQVVLSGVVICSRIDDAVENGEAKAWRLGAGEAFRPVILTTCLAMFGLIPASLSHAMGSETQRPFAIAIVAGLLVVTPAILLVMPLLYDSMKMGKDRSTT
ncbi:MAG: CusA/CzcA family heavy metal efflux RND transporter [Planctomycetales bacterium]